MVSLRLVLYLLAAASSLALFGRLVTVRRRLARSLAVAMFAWFFNAVVLLSFLLWWILTGNMESPWRAVALTVDAVLLAACPVLIYWFLEHPNGE